MRIAFLAPAHPLRGGIVQYVAVLAKKLLEAGHEVMIFSFHRQYPQLLFPGKDQVEPGSNPVDAPSQAVVTPYNPLTWPGAVRQISRWKPDLLVMKYWVPFFAPCFGWMARRIVRKTGCKAGYIIDNIDFHERWPLARQLTAYALAPASDLLVMSQSVEDTARRDFPRKRRHRVEHPDYDFFAFTRGTREEARDKFTLGSAPTLLFFGYIKPYKGLDLLLEAMPAILRELPEARLLVAGEVYGDESRYTALIDRLGIRPALSWHARFIANDEVAGFFRAADVAVLPYRSATQSGVTKAAFAFDLPVIATAVGGLGEVIREGENGFLVKPNDPEALAGTVIRYFRENLGPAMRKNIRFHKAGDTWQPLVEAIAGMGRKA